MTSKTKSEFEKQVKRIVSQTLKRVRYFEIQYEDNQSYWNQDDRFDSLDYGLDLEMMNGEVFGITWGAEFLPYGVSVDFKSLSNVLGRVQTWDVSDNSRWADLIGHKILDARVYWSWVTTDGKRTEYPQNIELVFDKNHKVYLSAFEIRPDGSQLGMMDHITVFFSEDDVREFKIGLYEVKKK